MSDGLIIVTGANEPDQYRRLERQLRDAVDEIRKQEIETCDLRIRYDQGGLVSTELMPLFQSQEFQDNYEKAKADKIDRLPLP